MKFLLNRHKKMVMLLIMAIILLIPTKSFAHDAYFIQVLIDDTKYQYMGSVVEDSASFFSNESKHLETELGNFEGLPWDVRPSKEDFEEYEDDADLDNDILIYTFQPTETKSWYGKALNNAGRKDIDKAYFIQENLMPGLNDALRVVNGGKPFNSVKELIETGNSLAVAINTGGTVNDFKVTKKKTLDSKEIKGISENDYVTLTNTKNKKEVYQFPYRIKKGYSTKEDFEGDTEYISWHNLMYQANYSYAVHGYTLRQAGELTKPSALEEMIVDMFESAFNQLRNLLGLYDINDLVFNDGIRGSSGWTHGIMSKGWSDQAIAYHWLFQALAWSVIVFAIVKNLVQRNLATINPVMRISLMESIQNLIITGFLLANAIPVINMMMFLNAKLVSVFGATAPDFADLSGVNAYSNLLGGIIIQFLFLGIMIYMNFVYIMRSITIAILIATAPLFIVTIAFGGKWKQLFGTWIKELTGNIFLQSFHAFTLSFFFSIATSSRGIEGLVVLFALIPMTEFFRSLVLGQGGGIAHSMGMKSMSQAGSLVGGAVSTVTGTGGKGKPSSSKSNNGGSGREVSNTSLNDSGMSTLAGNSDKIKNNSANMNQRQRMNSTKETMGNKQTPISVADTKNHPDLEKFSGKDMQSTPQTKAEKAFDMMKEAKEHIDGGLNVAKGVGETAVGLASPIIGGATMAVGLGTSMAMGMENPKMANSAMKAVGTGKDIIDSGAEKVSRNVGNATNSISGAINNGALGGKPKALIEGMRKKHFPSSTQSYATTLPNGDMQVHRPLSAMKEQGVLGATMDSNKNAVYTYDSSKLDDNHKRYLNEDAYTAFKDNNQEAMAHYKKQGIEYVNRNASGNLVVGYNQVGMEKMGIKSVQTIGATGSNGRIVETKTPSMPYETAVKINTAPYTASTQTAQNPEQPKNTN